jgi:EAL domain-containing protein (putative c-di-GMP-specific phosphodiesterase class I)
MATQSNRLVAANTERSFRACPAQDMRHVALSLNSRRIQAGAVSLDAAELRRALESQELTLHYQPKLTVGGSTMVAGVEALVRWNHPQLGLLLPGQFLPLAETAGLLTEITDFTITEAIQQHALWRDNGIDLSVAVNLAPALVRDEGFPDRLISSLRQFDVPPTRLTLDVKEMDGLSDRALCLEAFTRLRAAGIGLALDDYGSGLSSITELYRMPFTEVKIDGALIADASRDGNAGIVMRAIVRLAHELFMVVTAEGVETEMHLDRVIFSECDFVQGTLLCGPRPPADVERFLADVAIRAGSANPSIGNRHMLTARRDRAAATQKM